MNTPTCSMNHPAQHCLLNINTACSTALDASADEVFHRVVQGGVDPFSSVVDITLVRERSPENLRQRFEALTQRFSPVSLAVLYGQNGVDSLQLDADVSETERKAGRVEPVGPIYCRKAAYGRTIACWWSKAGSYHTLIRVELAEPDVCVRAGYQIEPQGPNGYVQIPRIPSFEHFGTPLSRWAGVFVDFCRGIDEPLVKNSLVKNFVCSALDSMVPTLHLEASLMPLLEVEDFDSVVDMGSKRDLDTARRLIAVQKARYATCLLKTKELASAALDEAQALVLRHGIPDPFFRVRTNMRLSSWVSHRLRTKVILECSAWGDGKRFTLRASLDGATSKYGVTESKTLNLDSVKRIALKDFLEVISV
jgi:hypothetical protein